MAKYKEKLERAAKEKGLSDVSELKEQYKDKIETLRKQAIVPGANAPLTPPPSPPHYGADTSTSPWPSPPLPPSPSAPPPGIKTLNSFLDLQKVRALPAKELQALWRLRHATNPQSIHFAMPETVFASLLHTAKQHPSFVLPLPREIPVENEEGKTHQAAELHYLQFAHPHTDTTTLLFTSLAEFKLRGEFASPHTTVTFHAELAESHGLVFGQGVVVQDKGVSVDEARWLVMCMQKFYVGGGGVGEGNGGDGKGGKDGDGKGVRRELLESFSRGDEGFEVGALIEEVEKVV